VTSEHNDCTSLILVLFPGGTGWGGALVPWVFICPPERAD